jgi:hypothetical protein
MLFDDLPLVSTFALIMQPEGVHMTMFGKRLHLVSYLFVSLCQNLRVAVAQTAYVLIGGSISWFLDGLTECVHGS